MLLQKQHVRIVIKWGILLKCVAPLHNRRHTARGVGFKANTENNNCLKISCQLTIQLSSAVHYMELLVDTGSSLTLQRYARLVTYSRMHVLCWDVCQLQYPEMTSLLLHFLSSTRLAPFNEESQPRFPYGSLLPPSKLTV
ncbi:hypothetical protein N1851_025753 [Merluccius polli]|uniref:Uncharacterized protein n=1 Tax=Merluccius polli TaxID=89951 RepID=A0AA47MDA4_MERPO|nr:hypothetical protein N1851_025753 [Merluccius polli]